MQNAHLVAALVALATALIPALTAVLHYRHNRYRRPPQFESWSHRERDRLVRERTAHINRIKGLLFEAIDWRDPNQYWCPWWPALGFIGRLWLGL
jgi:transposase